MSTLCAGGFPTGLFVHAPPVDFICGICLEVLKDPKGCKVGHLFCFSCISAELVTRKLCPTCKCTLTTDQLCGALAVRNFICQLTIKCDYENSVPLCQWTGTFDQLDAHKADDCQLQIADCPSFHNAKCHICSGKCVRGHLVSHLENNDRLNTYKHFIDELTSEEMYLMGWGLARTLSNGDKYSGHVVDGKKHGEGLISFAPSKVGNRHIKLNYCGQWQDDASVGYGVLMWHNNDVYYGYFTPGFVIEGLGSVIHGDGKRYSGYFVNGRKHGAGQETDTNGDVYKGLFWNDTRHGSGCLTCFGGTVVVGEWSGGKLTGPLHITYSSGLTAVFTSETTGVNNAYLTEGKGKLEFIDGTIYVGDFLSGQFHGRGRLTSPEQGVYEGEFVCGQRAGRGVMRYCDGSTYHGYYEGDKYHGEGTLWSKDGDHFSGNWMEGRRHGQGLLTLNCGDVYRGGWHQDQYMGSGVMKYACGDQYDGQWLRGVRQGKGIFTTVDKVTRDAVFRYEGQWHQNQRHGEGVLQDVRKDISYSCVWHKDQPSRACEVTYADNSVYIGPLVNYLRVGRGECTSANGDVYTGTWSADVRSGEGKCVFVNGDVYSGCWENDQISSYGRMTYNRDRSVYKGMWLGNMRCGHGTLKTADGSVRKGNWSNDQQSGRGEATFANGDQFCGEWIRDEIAQGDTDRVGIRLSVVTCTLVSGCAVCGEELVNWSEQMGR